MIGMHVQRLARCRNQKDFYGKNLQSEKLLKISSDSNQNAPLARPPPGRTCCSNQSCRGGTRDSPRSSWHSLRSTRHTHHRWAPDARVSAAAADAVQYENTSSSCGNSRGWSGAAGAAGTGYQLLYVIL